MIELTEDSFKSKVLDEKSRVLVDFNAVWCGPCQMMKSVLEEISDLNEMEDRIFSVNVDEQEELAKKYDISSIPCLIVFENGQEIKRSLGVISRRKVLKMLTR